MIPEPYIFILLVLVAYRAWHLIAEDTVLERPRRWLVRLPKTWNEGDALPRGYRNELALFINCPWCAGAWVSLVTYVVYLATLGSWPDGTQDVFVGLGVWFALYCSVGLVSVNLDKDD
jgi:hypothetical protein